MKRVIIALTLFLLFSSPVLAFLNEPDNFRGMKFGSDVSEFNELMYAAGSGDEKVYALRDEKLRIGNADLKNIAYVFYKGKFFGPVVTFEGLKNFTFLIETYRQQYGEPDKPNRFMNRYIWWGSGVSIYFRYEEITGKGSINYYYEPIRKIMKQDKENAAKSAKGDL